MGDNTKLTSDQDDALVAIDKWLKDRDPKKWFFTLSGYAGTGKTFLLQHLINNLKGKPICCAPTGKAASVLAKKIKPVSVKTVHQLLYQPTGRNMETIDSLIEARVQEASGEGRRNILAKLDTAIANERDRLANMKVNFQIKVGGEDLRDKFVIVDEASMVGDRMFQDFEMAGCRVLFVGDAGQLPPVNQIPWFMKVEHDAKLREVMRQALDSPIIRLSIQIREGNVKQGEFKTGDCIMTKKDLIDPATWLEADQILTGRNEKRQNINRFVRKKKGFDHSRLPVAGDKMICLKNDHHKFPAWINGVQFEADMPAEPSPHGDFIGLNAMYEGAHFRNLEFYTYPCISHYDENAEQLDREMRGDMFECDFAYAVTVHRAQGSEWEFVLLADDKMRYGDKRFRQQFLYTAVTRAKKKLIWIQ